MFFRVAFIFCLSTIPLATLSPAAETAQAKRDANGFLVRTIQSQYQLGATRIRVLLPDKPSKKPHRVLYVLPVEAGTTTKWGDGLLEVKGTNFHNKYKLVCCEPTFSHLPWYCDHPTDLGIRQESYLLKAIIPFVESEYPVSRKAADRLLVGFSKSGWGAISLLLRNPDVFGKAAAWDAPLMQRQPNQYGMGPIFGDNENFDGYELSRLIQERGTAFRDEPRLAILGYGSFREHHTAFRTILDNAQVMHEYRDGPQRKHAWGSGWLPAAIEFLAKPASASK